ncbi:acyltransferase [Mucilaginibacter koreensis]
MHKPQQQHIFSIQTPEAFEQAALDTFRYQAVANPVYAQFVQGLNVQVEMVNRMHEIPFMPVEFFKSHQVITEQQQPQVTFTSSGTTGMITSQHLVADVSWYEMSFRKAFELFYGSVTNYCVLAVLPSYLERQGSSLIYMADDLIKQSRHPDSGFYLYNYADLHQQLLKQQQTGQPTLLIGVTFALLDFVEQYTLNFPELIVMETGGMKGRRKEMIRDELHSILNSGFGTVAIHSEYGMTELLSQAYSKGSGIFECPPWMRIITRDTNDPLHLLGTNATGGVNIIDLANINSCSFIATQDLGRVYEDQSFEILGRFDNADIRGCNLLVA